MPWNLNVKWVPRHNEGQKTLLYRIILFTQGKHHAYYPVIVLDMIWKCSHRFVMIWRTKGIVYITKSHEAVFTHKVMVSKKTMSQCQKCEDQILERIRHFEIFAFRFTFAFDVGTWTTIVCAWIDSAQILGKENNNNKTGWAGWWRWAECHPIAKVVSLHSVCVKATTRLLF